MKIGAAKTESADPGTARRRSETQPRTRFGHHVERAVGKIRGRIRGLDVQGRWQHPVVQRQRHLDHPGTARRCLGVADHRLDRAHATELVVAATGAEGAGKAVDLDPVANHGAGAMGLDRADRGRRDPGAQIGAVHGAFLALGARCRQRQVAPVG